MPAYEVFFNPEWPNANTFEKKGDSFNSLEEADKTLRKLIETTYPYRYKQDGLQYIADFPGSVHYGKHGLNVMGYLRENLSYKENLQCRLADINRYIEDYERRIQEYSLKKVWLEEQIQKEADKP